MLGWLWALLVPIGSFGLFLEGKMWFGGGFRFAPPRGPVPMHLAEVSDPTQVGPNRSDPSHYDEFGRYLRWGC